MCGIAGLFKTGHITDPEMARQMAKTLAHRGPNARGHYHDNNIALAHTRLSIIDLSGGDQPLYADNKNLVLIANGEIYNHVELRAQLIEAGHPFQTHSDCEVILHGFREFGETFIERLHGMFAFALYDKRRNKLWLGRDRLGIKPLFYSRLNGGFVFASELKAIFAVMPNKPNLRPEGLAQYLQNQYCSGRSTVVENIEKVLPAELICINQDLTMHSKIYWQPLKLSTRKIDYPQAELEFDLLFNEVMTQHMRSDVPFGLFLSGGVDSSILLAKLTELSDKPLHTFSVGFPNTKVDNELPAAQQLAKAFHTEHTVLATDANAMLRRLPYSVWCADDLMRDNASLPTSLLAQTAAESLRVVFSGEGGDEVFAGYGRYRSRGLEAMFKNWLAPGSGGFRTRGTFRGALLNKLFAPQLRPCADSFRQPIIKAWQSCPTHWSHLQRKQYTDIKTALTDNLLVKADRMLMGFGLEGRVPFLDHRVVEFGLSLPDNLKIHGREKKFFLKKWATRWLPKSQLFGRKRGFVVPMGEWLDAPTLNRLEQCLPNHRALEPWIKPDGIRLIISQHRVNKSRHRPIWALVQLAIWHQLFVEGNGQAPPFMLDPLELLQ